MGDDSLAFQSVLVVRLLQWGLCLVSARLWSALVIFTSASVSRLPVRPEPCTRLASKLGHFKSQVAASVFGPEHYSTRASELEAEAKRVSDSNIRDSYLELARSFREMADLSSLARAAKDDEIVCLEERMVGKTNLG
jgi:hypothetical protein